MVELQQEAKQQQTRHEEELEAMREGLKRVDEVTDTYEAAMVSCMAGPYNIFPYDAWPPETRSYSTRLLCMTRGCVKRQILKTITAYVSKRVPGMPCMQCRVYQAQRQLLHRID